MSNFISTNYGVNTDTGIKVPVSTSHSVTCGYSPQFKGSLESDTFESSEKKKRNKTSLTIGLSILALCGIGLGILKHRGEKALGENAKFWDKVKQGWKEFRGKGVNVTFESSGINDKDLWTKFKNYNLRKEKIENLNADYIEKMFASGKKPSEITLCNKASINEIFNGLDNTSKEDINKLLNQMDDKSIMMLGAKNERVFDMKIVSYEQIDNKILTDIINNNGILRLTK